MAGRERIWCVGRAKIRAAPSVPMDHAADRRQSIRTFLARNFLLSDEPLPVGDDDSLMDHGIVDSTGVLELILFLEETFGVTVPDHEAVPRNLDSVARIAAFVDRRLGASRAG